LKILAPHTGMERHSDFVELYNLQTKTTNIETLDVQHFGALKIVSDKFFIQNVIFSGVFYFLYNIFECHVLHRMTYAINLHSISGMFYIDILHIVINAL
jgi:hypothetical protein